MQRLSIRSFLAQGHDYHLYAYDAIDGVPDRTTMCDAAAILPADRIFSYQDGFGKGSHSAFSNQFRYKLIHDRGGWWVDTDVVCLRPFDFAGEYVFATENEDDQSILAATCVFKSPAGAEYLDYCLKVCDATDLTQVKWSQIGPYLFDQALTRYGLKAHAVAAGVFNPVNYFEFTDLLRAVDPARLADAYAVHLWHQMWQSRGTDLAKAPPGSLYAMLEARYAE